MTVHLRAVELPDYGGSEPEEPARRGRRSRSRANAWRDGLAAHSVLADLEDGLAYRGFETAVICNYGPRFWSIQLELLHRLASLMWRLRRAVTIETGLSQSQCRRGRPSKAAKKYPTKSAWVARVPNAWRRQFK